MVGLGRFVYVYENNRATGKAFTSKDTSTTPVAVTQSPDSSILNVGPATSTITTINTQTAVQADPIKPTSTLPSITNEVGIAMGSQLTGLNDSDLQKEMDGLQAMGVKLIRFDIEWGFVQYDSPNKYTWDRYDRIVNSMNAHGISGLGIITYTPQWARATSCGGGAHCPPKDPNQYAAFASAVANRYKNKGMHYWEIWNEPNDYDFWATKADCNAYTALLKATYPAIKKADPTAFIITGGLAQVSTTNVNYTPLDFLQCIYQAGAKNYFDAVGYHPYTFPQLASTNNTNAWARMSLTVPSIRSIMIANGDENKKVWMTEFGAPTGGPDSKWFISEQQQAQTLIDAITLYKTYDWAGPLFWYTYKDGGTTTDTNENFFGLVRNDYSQKPAYQTMKNILTNGL